MSLQKDQASRFDANRNGVVEWSEFFNSLRAQCERNANVLTKGGIRQVPQANKLAAPVLQIVGR